MSLLINQTQYPLKYTFLFLVSFLPSFLFSQVLNNTNGEAFSDKPFFNESFILQNKIKSIKGQFNYKRTRQAMIEKNYYYVYNFDEKGRLVSTYETRKDDGSVDTTWNVYLYNAASQLMEHKRGNANGKTSNVYIYDGDRQIREEFWTESIDSTGKQTRLLFNSESIVHSEYLNQQREKHYNSYGLPYLEKTTYTDSLGYRSSEETRMLMTNTLLRKTFYYNEKGYLSKQFIYDDSKTPTESYEYTYDQFGNLIQTYYYKDGIFTTDTQIVYNDQSRLMTAVIIREVATDFIMVLRFKGYEYY